MKRLHEWEQAELAAALVDLVGTQRKHGLHEWEQAELAAALVDLVGTQRKHGSSYFEAPDNDGEKIFYAPPLSPAVVVKLVPWGKFPHLVEVCASRRVFDNHGVPEEYRAERDHHYLRYSLESVINAVASRRPTTGDVLFAIRATPDVLEVCATLPPISQTQDTQNG